MDATEYIQCDELGCYSQADEQTGLCGYHEFLETGDE